MDNFAEALLAVRTLKDEGVVTEYAIGGAMALAFWSEPTPTFDLDVFVLMQSPGILVDLSPLYAWAARHRYPVKAEHIEIAGVPVQAIPAPNALAETAVETAAELDYAGVPVRVIRPEYLIALSLQGSARTAKRLARVGILLESPNVDRELLDRLLETYNLQLPTL